MNWKYLRQSVGKSLRLRPIANRAHGRLPAIDDRWFIRSADSRSKQLEIENTRTGHLVRLGSDNIREYRSPDFLVLRCQIYINDNRIGPGVELEPLVWR